MYTKLFILGQDSPEMLMVRRTLELFGMPFLNLHVTSKNDNYATYQKAVEAFIRRKPQIKEVYGVNLSDDNVSVSGFSYTNLRANGKGKDMETVLEKVFASLGASVTFTDPKEQRLYDLFINRTKGLDKGELRAEFPATRMELQFISRLNGIGGISWFSDENRAPTYKECLEMYTYGQEVLPRTPHNETGTRLSPVDIQVFAKELLAVPDYDYSVMMDIAKTHSEFLKTTEKKNPHVVVANLLALFSPRSAETIADFLSDATERDRNFPLSREFCLAMENALRRVPQVDKILKAVFSSVNELDGRTKAYVEASADMPLKIRTSVETKDLDALFKNEGKNLRFVVSPFLGSDGYYGLGGMLTKMSHYSKEINLDISQRMEVRTGQTFVPGSVVYHYASGGGSKTEAIHYLAGMLDEKRLREYTRSTLVDFLLMMPQKSFERCMNRAETIAKTRDCIISAIENLSKTDVLTDRDVITSKALNLYDLNDAAYNAPMSTNIKDIAYTAMIEESIVFLRQLCIKNDRKAIGPYTTPSSRVFNITLDANDKVRLIENGSSNVVPVNQLGVNEFVDLVSQASNSIIAMGNVQDYAERRKQLQEKDRQNREKQAGISPRQNRKPGESQIKK